MTGFLGGLLILFVGAGLFLLRTVVSEVAKREYDSWAPALARALAGLAGCIHPRRADEWMADILYLQDAPERSTGLWEAFCHICGAPKLAGFAIVGRLAEMRLFRLRVSSRGLALYGVFNTLSALGVLVDSGRSPSRKMMMLAIYLAGFLSLTSIKVRHTRQSTET